MSSSVKTTPRADWDDHEYFRLQRQGTQGQTGAIAIAQHPLTPFHL